MAAEWEGSLAEAARDVIVRRASYGLELVDVLSGGPLVGSHSVSVDKDAVSFVVNRSRWVFEDLAAGPATFDVEAANYVPRQVVADGTGDFPEVPPLGSEGAYVRVEMLPRTGYPFAPTLTRAVGLVRVDPAVDPTSPIVAGADVQLTPEHVDGGTTSGTVLNTRTTEDGQYVGWFGADPALDPPLPNQVDVTAQAVVDGTPLSGSLSDQPLLPNVVNALPTILLAP
ncbi:MAG: hypothetical protein ACOCUA_01620 [archaeon]